MKKIIVAVLVVFLSLFAVVAIPAAHATIFVFPGGSVTTGPGAWDGGSGTIYDDTHVSFDVTKADLIVTVYGIDMTHSRFPVPPGPVYAGWPAPAGVAGIQVGVTQQTAFGSPWINPSSSAFYNLLIAGGGGPIGNDYYQTQAAYTDAASHLYENKSTPWDGHILGQGFNTPYLGVNPPLGGFWITGNPLYDTFDMQLTFHYLAGGDVLFTPLIRVYATTDPWSYPAMVWLPTFPGGDVFVIPGLPDFDWSNVKPFVFVGNWGAPAGGRTITWNSVQADGSPNYYLKVTSAYGTSTGEDWYAEGTTAYAGLTSGTVPDGAGKQHVFTTWSNDASGTNYVQSDPITMDSAKEAIANWMTQWQQTFDASSNVKVDGTGTVVTVNYVSLGVGHSASVLVGSLPWSVFVDDATTVTYSFSSTVGSSVGGKRYRYDSVSDPLSGYTASAPNTVTATYVTQYLLTVNIDPPGTATIPGQGYYDVGKPVTLTAPNGPPGATLTFLNWDLDSTPKTTNPIVVTMSGPHTATAHYYRIPVGGEWAPINTVQVITPWVALAFLAIAFAAAGSHRLLKKRW
jgi:hypothetical protein